MTVKILKHPSTGRIVRLGRRRPIARGPRLKLARYMPAIMPTIPANTNYRGNAAAFLAQILANDRLGDCTAAGAFHIDGLLLGNAGQPITFTEDDAVKFYSATTGYVPGDPSTDRGGDEVTVLNYWRQYGLVGNDHKISAWVSVDAANEQQVRLAMYLFENLYFGVELPDAWVNPFPSGNGFTWDVAGDPDPENGHSFVGIDLEEGGILIDTWGMIGTMTQAAIGRYASSSDGSGELYAVLSQDAINRATAKSPTGFDFAQLQADIAAFH